MRIIIIGGITMTSASVFAGLWAHNGSPVAFAAMVFLSFCTLVCFVQRYSDLTTEQSSMKAEALLRSEGRTSAKTLIAADTLADTLAGQDQITADTLEEADRKVTRNVKSKDPT